MVGLGPLLPGPVGLGVLRSGAVSPGLVHARLFPSLTGGTASPLPLAGAAAVVPAAVTVLLLLGLLMILPAGEGGLNGGGQGVLLSGNAVLLLDRKSVV